MCVFSERVCRCVVPGVPELGMRSVREMGMILSSYHSRSFLSSPSRLCADVHGDRAKLRVSACPTRTRTRWRHVLHPPSPPKKKTWCIARETDTFRTYVRHGYTIDPTTVCYVRWKQRRLTDKTIGWLEWLVVTNNVLRTTILHTGHTGHTGRAERCCRYILTLRSSACLAYPHRQYHN